MHDVTYVSTGMRIDRDRMWRDEYDPPLFVIPQTENILWEGSFQEATSAWVESLLDQIAHQKPPAWGYHVAHSVETKLLQILGASGGTTLKQEQLLSALKSYGGSDSRSSRNGVAKYLKRLRDNDLIHRPVGKRGGDAITDAGRRELARLYRERQ